MTHTDAILGSTPLRSRTMEFIGDLERAFASLIYPNRVPIAIGTIVVLIVLAIVARRRGWHLAARRHPRATGAIALAVAAIGLPLGWYLASPLFLSTTIDEPLPPLSGAPSPVASPLASASPAAAPVAALLSGSFSGADEFHFGRGTATLLETEPGRYIVRFEDFEVRNGPDLYVYLSPSADGYADGAIELGRLKADKGNQNYELPPDVDLGEARSVVIWCRQFSVLFAVAPLAAG
jgi:hypothetical protein